MDPVVEMTAVNFSYQQHPVLENIQLTISQGDFLGVMGPNGGGKTTLLKIILGLLRPDQGKVRVFGSPPRKGSRQIGYVPQYIHFDATFPITTQGVVLMGLLGPWSLGFWFNPEEKRAAYLAMEATGVSDLALVPFGNLSGGQRQRVLLARALVSNPKLLILDEPTSSVDYHGEEEFYSLLLDLNQEATIVLVSHDLGVISTYVKKVACVNRFLVVHSAAELDREKVGAIYHSPVRILEHHCML